MELKRRAILTGTPQPEERWHSMWLPSSPPGPRPSYCRYISFAWKLDQGQSDAMYANLPKWANSSYRIEANTDGNPTKDQMRLMMQSLLADRFKLRIHV